ncbi:hypothetical protein AAFC00_004576 [Neodothiora populina]|uniref:F-box domain-containing protein n=1 Tax=Neodothiora populina TaxID=2781224 RepID=A0ABR3P3A2_9PEZI
MATPMHRASAGVYSLPNELLYHILEPLPTKTILHISPTSRRFHALCVRLLHNRLASAASLADHVLYLEAFPPSAKLTATGLYCESLGTPNLHSTLASPDDAGKIGRLGNLYSCFRPQRAEPPRRPTRRHPAGDIPGSRTFTPPDDAVAEGSTSDGEEREPDLIGETISLDPQELFTQLCAVAHMVKIGRQGLFTQVVDVCDGMIRVWRDWLKERAREAPGWPQSSQGPHHPSTDDRTLWVNKGDHTVGVRCAVTERKWKRDNPVLIASEDEVAVSYHIEFQELYIRTSHLLFKLEQARQQEDNAPSKAVVFI